MAVLHGVVVIKVANKCRDGEVSGNHHQWYQYPPRVGAANLPFHYLDGL